MSKCKHESAEIVGTDLRVSRGHVVRRVVHWCRECGRMSG